MGGREVTHALCVAVALLALGLGAGCKNSWLLRPPADDSAERSAMRTPTLRTMETQPSPPPLAEAHGHSDGVSAAPLRRCFVEDRSGAPARPLDALLSRAADLYDGADYVASLACAEEAVRVDRRSIEAHHDRASALVELGRPADAETAFLRALALDPDDPETLAGAADLYVNRLPPSNDRSEIGLELARRGTRRLKSSRHRKNRQLEARLALLEGQALNDLGRPRDAIARLEAAIAADPTDSSARYERADALFETCRFLEAKKAFSELIAKHNDDAWLHHQLGLVLERLGDQTGADRELAAAERQAPKDFRAAVEVSVDEFRKIVFAEAARLSPTLRADLGRVRLETADVPDVIDLLAEDPPLSPTILGLFRGLPLDEGLPSDERTIVLYRKNLARAVADRAELVTQVRTTLLHELGHVRGEDDDALRARGLD